MGPAMRASASLVLSMSAFLLASCNSSPSSADAQRWFADYVATQSQGTARIGDFDIVSSEEAVLSGAPAHRISYSASVEYPNGNQPDCLLRLCVITDGRPFMLPGSIVRYTGELVFQKATSRWVVTPEWTRPPQVAGTELGNNLQCSQIADVVRLATQNENRGRVALPNITNPQETSRSDSELRCTIQVEQTGQIGTIYARAYEDGSGVRLSISRNESSGASTSLQPPSQSTPDSSSNLAADTQRAIDQAHQDIANAQAAASRGLENRSGR